MTDPIHDREATRLERFLDWALKQADKVLEKYFWPDNEGLPIRRDPTYGRIDRDIQWRVHKEFEPSSRGQRVAIENTLQDKRAKGFDV